MIMMMPRNELPRTTMVVPSKEEHGVLRHHPDDLATAEDDGRRRFKRKRSPTTSFPIILYDLLEDAESQGYTNTISWLPDGTRFQIRRPTKFRDEIMTKYFRQTKLESFTRQLYIYGFSKDAGFKKEDMVFVHPDFQQGKIDACRNIGRNQSGDRRVKRKEEKSESASIVQLQQLEMDQQRQNHGAIDQRTSHNDVLPWREDHSRVGDRKSVGMLDNVLSVASVPDTTDIRPTASFMHLPIESPSSISNLDLEPRTIEEMLHDSCSYKMH